MRLMISEVLQKVSNAKTKAEKIKLLQEHNTDALRSILIINFDESVVCLLPEGAPPYKPNEAPKGTEHTVLEKEARLLFNFFKGGNPSITQTRREMIFIQMLEGLHADEAEVVVLAKDKKLTDKYKRITFNVIQEAFPQIKWGGRS
jgi:hypothetical protein